MPSPSIRVILQKNCTTGSVNNINGVVDPDISTGPADNFMRITEITSRVTPGFRHIKKINLNALPYQKLTRDMQDNLFYALHYWSTLGGYDRTSHWDRVCSIEPSLNLGPTVVADDPYQRVVQKVLAELNQSKTNSLVMLAELNKTADHLAHTATRIYKSISALRRGHFRDFVTHLGVNFKPPDELRFFRARNRAYRDHPTRDRNIKQFLASSWLEYSYGWKPLLQDVYAHAEALAEQMTERSNLARTIRKKHKTSASKIVTSGQTGFNFLQTNQTDSVRSISMVVRYAIPNGGVPSFVSFGVLNPLEVAWELVPFSFVADWFLPVGDYLRSLTATHGLVFIDGSFTTKQKQTINVSVADPGTEFNLGGALRAKFAGCHGKYTDVQYAMKRFVIADFPSPTLPQWKDPRSLAHAASAISLLTSLFLH